MDPRQEPLPSQRFNRICCFLTADFADTDYVAESDLYFPLKRAFEAQGYAVFAEVNACDLAARRGDELLIVEMKRAFNLELVFQGLERQRATETVYLAFEAPARYERK